MELTSYFEKFLRDIRPTENQINDMKSGHETLRKRLLDNEDTKDIIISIFLQGSYRRSTAIRPKGDTRSDVDIVVVTNLDKEDYHDPSEAMDIFEPFLNYHYDRKWRRQSRSFRIILSYVDLDLVITAAPLETEVEIYKSLAVGSSETIDEVSDWRLVKSWVPPSRRNTREAEILMEAAREEVEWKSGPLWIPDRKAGNWEQTHPIEQIKWTFGKNARCNSHYINVVKAIKWWQRVNYEDDCPKGYPLEHLIGVCCPDGINSVAEGVHKTFETIHINYSGYAANKEFPFLEDHGVPGHNVLGRVRGEEFSKFIEHILEAADIAREAYESDKVIISAKKWRELFGTKFPSPPDDEDKSEKGPFIVPSLKDQTGDLTPRKYGK